MMPARASLLLRHFRRLAACDDSASDKELLRRFARERDEAAFAVLARRHAPMVVQVCRRTLSNWHDAEDVCQAVFLVLASKAGSRGWQESVGPWLHRVAHHLALKARTAALRRAVHESRAAVPPPAADHMTEITGTELRAVLDEELVRLPDKYRAPLVLCYLEGATRDEAARQLGWPVSTLKSRVERGRELLGRRLSARGLTLSMGLSTALLLEKPTQAALPAGWIVTTTQAAVSFAAGRTSIPGIASHAERLARLMLQTMLVSKLKTAVVCLLALCLLSAGVGLAARFAMTPTEHEPERQGEPLQLAGGPQVEEGQKRRDQYGDPLPANALARLGTSRFRHALRISSIAWTPDGKLLSCGGDGIRLWELPSGKELPRFPLDSTSGFFAALSPDGKLAALSVSGKGGVSLWDFNTGQKRQALSTATFGKLLFSPDGKLLLGYGSGARMVLWEVASGREAHAWVSQEPGGRREAAAFTPDGRAVIVGDDKVIRFFDVATGQQVREIAGHPNMIGALAVSTDGARLATIGQVRHDFGGGFSFAPDRFIRLWDLRSGKEIRQLAESERPSTPGSVVSFLSFSPDGKKILACSNRVLRVWDATTGSAAQEIALDGPCSYFAFAPDGKTMALALGDSIVFADLLSGKLLPQQAEGHRQTPRDIVIAPDGRTVATASFDSNIWIWDAATGRQRIKLQGHQGFVSSLLLASDGHTLLSAGQDKALCIWDLTAAKLLRRLPWNSTFPAQLLAISSEDKTIALTADRSSVALLDLATGHTMTTLPDHGARVTSAFFSSDNRTLWTCTMDQTLRWWEVGTGRLVRQLPDPPPPPAPDGVLQLYRTAAVSPDGQQVAYAGRGSISLQELATNKEIWGVDAASARILTFSSDHHSLAAGFIDGRIVIFEVATGKQRGLLTGHRGWVEALRFSADSRLLVSGSMDTTALVWDLTGRLAVGDAWGKPLSDKELDQYWKELASDDATQAFQAIQRLAASPAQSVSYLAQRLQPVPVEDPERLAGLLKELGSSDFAARQQATKDLDELGEAAFGAYQSALAARPGLELRQRLEVLVNKCLEKRRHLAPENLRKLRSLETLERCGTPDARLVLEKIAKGTRGAWLTEEAAAGVSRLSARLK